MKDQKGMTLIELLAVIVIIAIIAAIAIPAIAGIIENSRVGAIKSDATNILNAADLYNTEATPGTSVTLFQLESAGFIEDSGSFEGLSETEKKAVSINLATGQFTGTNEPLNGITIAFEAATKNDISRLPNSAENGAYVADPVYAAGTSITVSGR
ncbi:prepilin-type N-terminal cleavage/methylation domain-containing protein [Planomicrobium chinense]|nr:prepilin-type N-terminal cleavage/methylation domain-containing protein [Planococcus chinensis]